MSYCADILVPVDDAPVPRFKVVQTGDASQTAEETLARACFTAGVYYMRDAGYPYAFVQLYEVCDVCGGSGRLNKRRGKRPIPYAWRDCKACVAKGNWPVGELVKVSK